MLDLRNGNCLEVLKEIQDNSIDAIVTDPPYGLAFMGKKWDCDVPSVEIWQECLRVLKQGGHLLSFAGSRTYHRMVINIEDAGFEIRDQIMWVYGTGFPKSLDVSKAIDKAAGAERKVIGVAGKSGSVRNSMAGDFAGGEYMETAPATDKAKQWQGWGTALKPAHEPICLARKPFDTTVAENVLTHGTGALNIDGCRIDRDIDDISGWSSSGSKASENIAMSGANYEREAKPDNVNGRFPANFIHDGLETEWARFFYCPKASKKDRNEGLPLYDVYSEAAMTPMRDQAKQTQRANNHPTVKPTELMRYLCRLITPPNGIILDPFMGSGSTGKAAMLEGFSFIGIEMEEDYFKIAEARIKCLTR